MELFDTKSTNNTAAFFRLVDAIKRSKENNRPFCLFIGAGCSLSSSLNRSITTEQIIKDCLIKNSPPDYQIPSTWEELYKDFVNNVWQCLAPGDRLEMLHKCLKDLTPSVGYKCMKILVENGYIQNIITTNFDMLLDTMLIDIPHNVYVSEHPVRRVKGGSNISLLKVHGDIESGELRFSPSELTALPNNISKLLSEKSDCNCLVCGYRGQDLGVMKSLSQSKDYASFWASPTRPSEYDYFETSNIYSWMQLRNSKSNFIYGDILGSFDDLMKQLVEQLIGTETGSFLPNFWENNIIVDSIKVNEKTLSIFCDLINCSEKLSQNYKWQIIYPFYAENYQNVLNAYLFFYQNQVQNIPEILKIPENEVESLLIGIAIEIVSRTSGISITALDYAKKIKCSYESVNHHFYPDNSFWEALFLILSYLQNVLAKPIWKSIENIKLNMNSGGRFSLNVKKPMLKKIATALSSLNLCSILCPTSEYKENDDIKLRYKRILENKSHHIDEENSKLVLHFENITQQEFENINQIFFKNHQAIINGNAVVSIPIFSKTVPSDRKVDTQNLSEFLFDKSSSLTSNFLKLKTAFDFDTEEYVKTPTEDAINDFLLSSKAGMFLIGSSGSGKTKTIQHFCQKNVENYIVAATAPKCNNGSEAANGIGFFFDDLSFASEYSQEEILVKINTLLEECNRKLVLIYDGLNEISSNTEMCVACYKKLLETIEIISKNNLKNCKLIVSCRDLAFLDYCNNCGLYPSSENCYCNTNNLSAVPYYQIPPLSLELQIDFCKTYIKNINLQEAFITDLKNNRFIRNSFTHPYLIAIAGRCYNKTSNDNSLLISNVFAQFTQQMLKRLTFSEDEILAKNVIDTYCSLLISSKSKNPKITTFLLLNSEKLCKERVIYSRILKELQDINLFTKEETTDRIRISHDRIEEYVLSNFLYNSLEPQKHVNQVVTLATTDSIFSCALQSYFDRCIINNQYIDILDNLITWYNINPQLIPTSFVCSIGRLKPHALNNFINYALYNSKEPNQIIEIIILGLKQALSFGQLDYPYSVFDSLDVVSTTNVFLQKYRAHWKYIASKYYSGFQKDQKRAIDYCEDALNFCKKDSDIYHIISLQLNILQCNYNDDLSVLNTFENLYTHFKENNEMEFATECVLNWGSYLRKCSKFEEAIIVYNQINPLEISNSPQLCSSLLRKTGTAHKNIVQRILRKYKEYSELTTEEKEELTIHYNSAIEAFQAAKHYLKHRISVEMLSLISEMTETAIIVVPLMPEQRYFADVYLAEEEKLLSYIPVPEHEVLFMRNKARLLEHNGNYSEAITTLLSATKYAYDETMGFRLFEINYQVCRLVCRRWEQLSNSEREIGLNALKDALAYPLDDNNEYRKVLISTQELIERKTLL